MQSGNSCEFLCAQRTHIEQVGDARSDDSAKNRTAEEICKRSQHALERGCGILRGLYRHGGDSNPIPSSEHAYQLDRTERPTLPVTARRTALQECTRLFLLKSRARPDHAPLGESLLATRVASESLSRYESAAHLV
jgi:hypothetical protein